MAVNSITALTINKLSYSLNSRCHCAFVKPLCIGDGHQQFSLQLLLRRVRWHLRLSQTIKFI